MTRPLLKYLENLNTKTTVLSIVVFVFLGSVVSAQKADSLFVAGNNFYKQEAYKEAIEAYKKIETQNVISADLFYNMANAYYKSSEVAPAIYYYEKTLKLDPGNEDAKYNLAFANRMTIDKIDVLPMSFFQKLDQQYIRAFKYDSWALIAIFSSILFVLLFLSYYFSFSPSRKRLYFISALMCIVILVASFTFAYSGYTYAKNNKPAIIFALRAPVKEAPTPNSNDAFELHEGTKVMILEQVDTWQKIKLADGKIGWIDENNLKAL
ncbi:MAG: tetratricopeptide repeat protein [Flavobacteriaceae bacterium]|nr:tetratricopeptide repeat protein [Flavobacteriaceae bacterium]